MGIFKKRQHKLPKFPDTVIPVFKQLCAVLDEGGIAELRKSVDEVLAFHEKHHQEKGDFDIRSAKALAECAYFLLEHYQDYPPKKQALLVGAVRYFAIAEDPFDETIFTSGFHDDAMVMNYVLEELGVTDRYIETI